MCFLQAAAGLLVLSLIGSCFDLLTLLILGKQSQSRAISSQNDVSKVLFFGSFPGHVLTFALPSVYESHRELINAYLGKIITSVKAKLDELKASKKKRE